MRGKPGPPGKPLEPTRVCHRCKIEKPITDYQQDRQLASGRKGTCRTCIAEMRRENAMKPRTLPLQRQPRLPGLTYRPLRKIPEPTRTCNKCQQEKPIENFPADKRLFSGRKSICNECHNAYRKALMSERDPKYISRESLWRRYRLTQERYDEMNIAQNNQCAICGKEEFLVVDHNHATGQVRALLCHACNSILGFARESSAILLQAAAYLDKWNGT